VVACFEVATTNCFEAIPHLTPEAASPVRRRCPRRGNVLHRGWGHDIARPVKRESTTSHDIALVPRGRVTNNGDAVGRFRCLRARLQKIDEFWGAPESKS
jgi:hypothetical protein